MPLPTELEHRPGGAIELLFAGIDDERGRPVGDAQSQGEDGRRGQGDHDLGAVPNRKIGTNGEFDRVVADRPVDAAGGQDIDGDRIVRSEEHTSEVQSLMRNSYAVIT